MNQMQSSEALVLSMACSISLRLPHLMVGAHHSLSKSQVTELPIFSVTSRGDGLANEETEKAMYAHIMQAGLTATSMYRAALKSVIDTNTALRSMDKLPRRYTVELQQHTCINKKGQAVTDMTAKITRVS